MGINIGILALQGDFHEHRAVLERLGYQVIEVRTQADLQHTAGLIMPGGESTAIGLQLHDSGLDEAIRQRALAGWPVYGTCAGAILLAKQVDSEFSLRLMNITMKRNAYGRQLDSFDEPIRSKQFPGLTGAFIRAPIITRIEKNVSVLAWHGQNPVLVQQGNLLAGTFHPELSGNETIHRYWLTLVTNYSSAAPTA